VVGEAGMNASERSLNFVARPVLSLQSAPSPITSGRLE
jgi:hypothetical protein